MPDDFNAFRKQRYRWAYGAMQIVRANAAALFNPFNRELTLGQRWHFVTGWLPWIGDALGLVFLAMGLAWSVGLILDPVRFEFPIALFMLPSIGLFVFKIVQILALYAQPRALRLRRTGWAPRSPASRSATASARRSGKACSPTACPSCARRR